MSGSTASHAMGGPSSPPFHPAATGPIRKERRIPPAFQLTFGAYILLTGTVPLLVQAIAFGVSSGVSPQFVAAVVSQLARELLLIALIVVLTGDPRGLLHPLLVAVVLLPVVSAMPSVIENFGGWAGVFAGLPVPVPHFIALPNELPTTIWGAVAKYNGLRVLALICTYFGFAMARSSAVEMPRLRAVRDSTSIRALMIAFIIVSLIVLMIFIRTRGGLNTHLTSLGFGRYQELSRAGVVIVAIHLGSTALYVWLASRPGDLKSPLFLLMMAMVTVGAFIANGSRSSALEGPLMIGLIWAIRRKKIPWKTGLLLIPLMFVSVGLLGAIRTANWTGSNASAAASQTTWSESFKLAQEEVDIRRATSAPIPVTERGMEVTGGPLLGKSYGVVFTSFIPRFIWPGKPRGVGSLFAQLFLGAERSGTTIPVGPEAEMYWNFGIPGVAVLSLLFGALLRAAYQFYIRRENDPFALVFYVAFLNGFAISSDLLVGWQQDVLLILVCYAGASIFIRKQVVRPQFQPVGSTGRPVPIQPSLR